MNRLTVCAIVPERSEWDREALRWGGDGEAVQPACPACTLPHNVPMSFGRHRWTTVQGKMTRRRKPLEVCARRPQGRQSPASGARFVSPLLTFNKPSIKITILFDNIPEENSCIYPTNLGDANRITRIDVIHNAPRLHTLYGLERIHQVLT